MKLTKAHPRHFDLLELREEEKQSCLLDPASGVRIEQLIEGSIATTLTYQGKIICIMGFYELWPGVINIWLFPSIYAPMHPVPFLRTVKRCVQNIIRDLKPHRVQSMSIDNALHCSWMSFLGFTLEGRLPDYTADKVSYLQWGIVL